MNQTPANDEDLRAAFDTLRRETNAGLTPFDMPRSPTRRRTLRWHVRPMLATGLLAAVIAGVVLERRAMERREMLAPFLTSTTWESPTDFLLATPGKELLNTVPTLTSSLTDSINGTPQ